jgi:thiol:disulfide interchange protein DsbD
VAWSAAFTPSEAAPGAAVSLKVKAVIEPTWHIYGMKLEGRGPLPTQFNVTLPEGWKQQGDWTPSRPPINAIDPGFQIPVTYHDGEIDFSIPVQISPTASPGEVTIQGTVRFMACDDSTCLPPRTLQWEARIQISGDGVAGPVAVAAESIGTDGGESTAPPLSAGFPEYASAAADASGPGQAPSMDSGREIAELRRRGLGTFLIFAILAGLASLLTPCVFPMIPITVSFFTKRANKTPRQGLTLAFIYGFGIVVTYSILGLLLSAVLGVAKGVSGAGAANWIAANPWVNLALTTLFVVFALSLFGLFDIQLPSGLSNRLQRAGSGRADALGAIIMALVFTITSFTCTVQFVGLLLVEAARGDWLWPGIGMVVYSSAFAAPFFLLALFPQAMARLPRSGPWLHSTKVLMGFLELAAAFKFLSNADVVWEWNIFTREAVLAAWAAIAFFTGLYLLGKIPLAGEPRDKQEVGTIRLLMSMGFVALGLYLASGLGGTRVHGLIETYLPPKRVSTVAAMGAATSSSAIAPGAALVWYDDLDKAMDHARQVQRPVFVDFTGYTCTNCRWMEINIFERPEIQALFRGYVLVHLYTDGGPNADANQRLQAEKFGTVALPYYALMRPDGSLIASHGGIQRNPAAFAEFLRKGLGG